MKREIFRRGVRMQHQFGDLEGRNDPLGQGTFDPRFPERVSDLSKAGASRPLEVQREGERFYRDSPSPVCKPGGGYASLNGPAPDLPQVLAMPMPVGSKRRLGPLKTDK